MSLSNIKCLSCSYVYKIAPLTLPNKTLNVDVVFSRRLCAPIASLDCMEEFSGNTGLDLSMGKFRGESLRSLIANYVLICSGRSISLGSKTSLKNVSSTPGELFKKKSRKLLMEKYWKTLNLFEILILSPNGQMIKQMFEWSKGQNWWGQMVKF